MGPTLCQMVVFERGCSMRYPLLPRWKCGRGTPDLRLPRRYDVQAYFQTFQFSIFKFQYEYLALWVDDYRDYTGEWKIG